MKPVGGLVGYTAWVVGKEVGAPWCWRARMRVGPEEPRRPPLAPLVLLRHSFCLTAFSGGLPQQGHRGRTNISVRARRMRSVAMEFGMWRCDRSGGSSGSVTCGNGRLRASPGAGRSWGGNRLLLGDQESVSCDAESCVMVKAAPTAAFIMTETDLLLEF